MQSTQISFEKYFFNHFIAPPGHWLARVRVTDALDNVYFVMFWPFSVQLLWGSRGNNQIVSRSPNTNTTLMTGLSRQLNKYFGLYRRLDAIKQLINNKQDQKDLLNLPFCRAINFYKVMQNKKVKVCNVQLVPGPHAQPSRLGLNLILGLNPGYSR